MYVAPAALIIGGIVAVDDAHAIAVVQIISKTMLRADEHFVAM
jgi:hypothetical protein